jgi:hypothetical protein
MNCPQCKKEAKNNLVAPFCSENCLSNRLAGITDVQILKKHSTARLQYLAKDTSTTTDLHEEALALEEVKQVA